MSTRLYLAGRFAIPLLAAICLPCALAAQRLSLGDTMTYPIEGGAAAPTVALSSQGLVAIGEPGDRRITVFDSIGQPLWTVGRRGAGPGEFKELGAVGWLGDTLWVSDGTLGRVTRFRNGELLGSTRYDPPRLAPGFRAGVPTALLPRGAELILPSTNPALFAGGGTATLPLIMVSNGQVIDTLGIRDRTGAVFMIDLGGGATFAGIQPIRSFQDWAVDPLGEILGLADWTSTEKDGRIRVTVRATSGATVWTREIPYTPREVPGTVKDSIVGSLREQAQRAHGRSPDLAALKAAIQLPAQYPPVTAVVVGNDGSIWIRREEHSGPRVEWQRVPSATGSVQGLSVPATHRIVAADSTRVWIIEYDRDDVPFVRRYALRIQ